MNNKEIIIWSIGIGFFLLSFLTILYMIKTAESYPKELEDEENEELLRKFKEYRDKKNRDK